jgi:hypothetical protein
MRSLLLLSRFGCGLGKRDARRDRFRGHASGCAALVAALAALGSLAAPGARAASISINPVLKILTCATPACDSLQVQLNLSAGEVHVDSFGFDINLDHAGILGLAIGPVPGNPIAGMNGTFELLADGTTLRGLLNSLPSHFDGPTVTPIEIATIPLRANGTGTAEFRFLSAEIFCSTCNLGAGQFYPVSNTPNQLLAVVQTPEPGSFALLALGLTSLGVAGRFERGRRPRREGGVQ